jgi:hypothetical protein
MTDHTFHQMMKFAVADHGAPALASLMRVSIPTIRRWSEGKNLPHEALREAVRKAVDSCPSPSQGIEIPKEK